MEYADRIEINPEVHFGQPCVAGTRVPVKHVVELVREGIPDEEIVESYYPVLTVEDVRACVEYGADD